MKGGCIMEVGLYKSYKVRFAQFKSDSSIGAYTVRIIVVYGASFSI